MTNTQLRDCLVDAYYFLADTGELGASAQGMKLRADLTAAIGELDLRLTTTPATEEAACRS